MALTDAWRVIERKKSAGGIDRQTVQSFERIHAKEIDILSEQLKAGNYVPQPLFDLIEEFRTQAVDKVVFSMLTKGEALKVSQKSGLLTDESRHKLIGDLLDLNVKSRVRRCLL